MTDGDGAWPGVDRAAALAHPPTRVPRKVIYWALAALVVLGGGGIGLEHLFTASGLNQYSVTASSAFSGTPHARSTSLSAPLRAFMGIVRVPGTPAPALVLTDQSGATLRLDQLRGRVVVLAFFDAACDDICPVLGSEIVRAESALGAKASRVAFVAVNSDPQATTVAATARTTAALGLARYHNWYFLTGTLGALDVAWTRYGITVEVAETTHRVAHTEMMYFIDPSGHERLEATPFANESRSGTSSLDRTSIDRFGVGIADYARQLLPR